MLFTRKKAIGPADIKRVADWLDSLNHSEHIAPVPTWEQVTWNGSSSSTARTDHIKRILGVDDEQNAHDEWNRFSSEAQRSLALIIDKISHEGWLDAVGKLSGWPWDGGFFFEPRPTPGGTLEDVLNSKSGSGGSYTACRFGSGLFAYLAARNHPGWVRSWIENDTEVAALHVGIFKNGIAEVHVDAFNALFTNGAPRNHLVRLPLLGSYNHRQFVLHRCFERSNDCGARVRASASLYHLMKDNVPLSF